MERFARNDCVSEDDGAEPSSDRECASLIQTVHLIQSLQHCLLGVVKRTLERLSIRDINETQALMLFSQGGKELKAGELRSHGHYFGSNVTYNLRKMVELGYLQSSASPTDRRACLIRLTPKGEGVRDAMVETFAHQTADFQKLACVSDVEFVRFNDELRRLQRFWLEQIRFFL